MNNFENARITSTSISMADHGILTIRINVEGDHWFQTIGNFQNGVGELGVTKWEGNGSAIVAMMKIMDVVGVSTWEGLKDKLIRVKPRNKQFGTIDEIGNILEDKWFNLRDFFAADDGSAIYKYEELK